MKTFCPPSVEKIPSNKTMQLELNNVIHNTISATIVNRPKGLSSFIQSRVRRDWIKKENLSVSSVTLW